MVDQDKPKVNLSFGALEDEDTPQPYVYMTKANKRVTFPDINEMEWDKGEEFMRQAQVRPGKETLQEWLSPEDFTALKADHLTARQMTRLVSAVHAYYEQFMGDAGKDNGSGN